MVAPKKLPWVSLALLLAAHITFGNLLASTTHSWAAFAFAIAWALVLALMFINLLTGLSHLVSRWFTSDTVAFCALIVAAAFASIVLNWLKLFMPIILILSAEALARIDLLTAEFNNVQTCTLLTVTSWIGLGLGWTLGQFT
ncbi:hypothetical protein C7B65_04330 [Phormidesmis priestleyi ULC007]|uniref:Uncharacterized protein n=1 Tax=Phormidesmis priestleyi ULC007 TaxID=1920490 RepID=A0A2T1DL45_9CYAN|nr:hypothetical protein [Phormidesmis priestleyi]PSB21171.1 hypothetical protein C7B65_04330 [Phormidesmis priestleyi ULC007]PZO51304.1 MAG: hypothetical protein DCF14_09380 [Phormidesmis priestleyi]